jgi:hypothetical protein
MANWIEMKVECRRFTPTFDESIDASVVPT